MFTFRPNLSSRREDESGEGTKPRSAGKPACADEIIFDRAGFN